MRISITAGAVGTCAVVGAVGVIAFTQVGSRTAVPASVNLVSASGPAAAAADQAALTYVDQTFPGSGTAAVLKTEADIEKGVAVYDVKVTAPNGSTYSLSIQASNDFVLAANLSETRGTQAADSQQTPDATQTPEPSDTPDATQTPEPSDTPDATQTPEPSDTPDATQTPEPSDTPDATQTPEPSATTSSDSSNSTGGDN